jgi:hypothetical protein
VGQQVPHLFVTLPQVDPGYIAALRDFDMFCVVLMPYSITCSGRKLFKQH